MFNIFKKHTTDTPYLEVLNTDIHCHLLPGVDDGSKSLDESIHCLRVMRRLGLKKVTLTPHFCFPRFPNDEKDIENRYQQMLKDIAEVAPDLDVELVTPGGEYRVDDGLPRRLEDGRKLLHTANNQYLLVELSLHQPRLGIEETLFDLQMGGEELILAHPERYPYYNAKSDVLASLHEQGIQFQVNLLSISGFYGEAAQKRAIDYIEEGWVDYLGTDLHNALYAKALEEAASNRKLQKVLSKYTFKNSQL